VGISADQLKASLDALAAQEPRMARALEIAGYPEPRLRQRGYQTLLRTIVGQQVSVAAAASVWAKLEAELGQATAPDVLLSRDYDALRACGLSRQKQGYARSLAELSLSGELALNALPDNDEAAIMMLTAVKGIGRWSAEIYLLFAEGRQDVFPAGDLAVQESLKRIIGLDERPTEKSARALAADWAPHRGSAAIFAWHCYNNFETI
jgi:DNA-3-methyladenine glycosylase II